MTVAAKLCARCGRRISRKAIETRSVVFSRFTRSYYCPKCSRDVGRVR